MFFKNKILKTLILSLFLLPSFVFSQTGGNPPSSVYQVSGVGFSTGPVGDNNLEFLSVVNLFQPQPVQITYQIEYGTASLEQNGDNLSFQGQLYGTDVLGYTPFGLIDDNNDLFLNIPMQNLMPSQYYYVRFLEWITDPNTNTPVSEVFPGPGQAGFIERTNDPQIINQSVNIANEQIQYSGRMVSSGGAPFSGVPIRAFLYQEDPIGPGGGYGIDEIPGNVVDPNGIVVDIKTTTTNGNGDFSFTFSDQLYGTLEWDPYYLNLFNDNSKLSFLDTTIVIPNDGSNTIIDENNDGITFEDEEGCAGLVCCQGPNCSYNQLIQQINRFIDFLLVLAIPIAAIMIIYSAIKLFFSGGNSSELTAAKNRIVKVILGIVFILSAWLIIKLVLMTFGYDGPLLQVLGIN